MRQSISLSRDTAALQTVSEVLGLVLHCSGWYLSLHHMAPRHLWGSRLPLVLSMGRGFATQKGLGKGPVSPSLWVAALMVETSLSATQKVCFVDDNTMSSLRGPTEARQETLEFHRM